MDAMTITEALAETKTLKARIEKKRQAVLPYLARDASFQGRDQGRSRTGRLRWASIRILG